MYLDPKANADFRGRTPVRSARDLGKRHFLFLLLPGANMLDFTAAIEPLRVCNGLQRETVYTWAVLSENGDPVVCSNGLSFPVGGGLAGTRALDHIVVCSGDTGYLDASAQTLQWLRQHARFGGRVTGVGTGAFTLARAGLATDTQLTLHWTHIPVFEEMFPDLDCVNSRATPGKTLSFSAGGSSSLDLTLSVIRDDFDNATAQRVAEFCLHDFDSNPGRAQRHPVSRRVGCRHPAVLNIIKRMEQSIQNPASLDELIGNEGISKRQIERLFSRYLNTSPSKYYRNLRLGHARNLLKGTDMPVVEVAVATGFSSAASFSKLYRRHFGERPSNDR